MRMRTIFIAVILLHLMAWSVASAGIIQDAIDQAAPGALVEIPAGVYQEAVVLKDGISLVGAGAADTIIDATGHENAVTGAKDALIVGFTIRNGKYGIHNDQNFIGVFDCKVEKNSLGGVWFQGGSGVVAHCLITDNSVSAGVVSMAADPYIANNIIANNPTGIRAWHFYNPVATQNIIAQNINGVHVGAGTTITLVGNTYSNNRSRPIVGRDLGEGDTVEAVTLDGQVPVGSGDIAEYRAIMSRVYEEKVPEHPSVIYSLGEPGEFGVAILSSWATFAIAAATSDTEIRAYEAFDVVTLKELASRFLQLDLPTIDVRNPALTEKDLSRYVLNNTYVHPASYFLNDKEQLVFDRETSVANIDVLVPAGYIPVSANLPATYSWSGERVVVRMRSIGRTNIKVVMEKATEDNLSEFMEKDQ